MQQLLDSMHVAPALVRNARLDIVAANPLGRALFAPADMTTPTNLARFTFLDDQATEFFADWDDVANATVALLRVEAGRNPGDHHLSDLVGELATRSDEFRVRWAGHNVRLHHHGNKRFHHPVVGDLTLAFEELPLPADPGLTITAYTAETGTASHDALVLLASGAPQPTRPQIAARHRSLRPVTSNPRPDTSAVPGLMTTRRLLLPRTGSSRRALWGTVLCGLAELRIANPSRAVR